MLGSYIVHELVKRKYDVRVMVREESNRTALRGLNIEYFVGMITVKKDVQRAVTGCTFVIHAAALAIHKPTRLDAFRNVNIGSTRLIVDACLQYGVKRMVFVSTANCFPNGTLESPGTETGEFPDWLKESGYAYSKFLAQELVLDKVRNEQLEAVVVNPTFIIGKDIRPDGGRIFSFILNKYLAFYPVGGKNFIDAGAAAKGVVNALEKGRSGECYLLAGENLSYRKFFKIVSGVTRQKSVLIPVPCLFLRLAGRIGNFFERVLGRPVQLTYVNARMLCLYNYYTPRKAVQELDLPVVSARESIEIAARWFNKVNTG